MIHTLNLTEVRARKSAIANRQFADRHVTTAQKCWLAFAAGVAITVIITSLVSLF